jgi:hypothetical protein
LPQFPHVHLNGTSREELLKQQIDVLDAINALDKALIAAQPHGRDYYLTSGAIEQATKEYRANRAHMEAIQANYQSIAEHLAGHRK